jgi:hypothetical protein
MRSAVIARKRPAPPQRGRAVIEAVRPAGTIAGPGDLAAYGFAARVYMAFDPPASALPSWVDVTPWVDFARAPIRITHGRSDGLAEINPGTATLTMTNTDLRFSPKNSNSPWNGLFGKGTWIRIDIVPPSGNASTRFVGFINSVQLGADGLDPWAVIGATDRLGTLQSAGNYISMIAGEVLGDSVYQEPSGQVTLQAYYPLHEAQGSLSMGDASGNAISVLRPVTVGPVVAGTGMTLSNTGAPGMDSLQAPTFAPPTATAGTVLQGTVTTPQQAGAPAFAIECWIKTTIGGSASAQHGFMSLADYTTNPYALCLGIDVNGYLTIYDAPPTPNGIVLDGSGARAITLGTASLAPPPVLNDGQWHHVYLWVRNVSTTQCAWLIAIDGRAVDGPPNFQAFGIPATLNTLHVGGALSWSTNGVIDPFNGSISDVAYYTTGVQFYGLPSNQPNFGQHAQAGLTGFRAERTDQRITRLARYAGVPQPIVSSLAVPASTGAPFAVWTNQSGVTGPWASTGQGAHQVGVQQIAGSGPLSAMRSAARVENMPVYADRTGGLAFSPNTSRFNVSAAWTVNALDLEKGSTWIDDYAYTQNQAVVTPPTGPAQTINGVASQAKSGIYSTSVNPPSASPYDAYSLGADIVARQGDPAPRPNSIVLIANTLAGQPGITVPAAMSVSNDFGFPVYLATSGSAYQGTQVYQPMLAAGSGQYTTVLIVTGVPVTAGTSYSWSAQARIGTFGQNIATQAVILFFNAAGANVGTPTGASTVIAGGSAAWTPLSVGGTAPAGAVTATLKIQIAGGATTAPTAYQGDALQLQVGPVTPWQLPGAGSPNLLTVDQATAGEGTPYQGAGVYGPAWYDAVLASDVSTPMQVTTLPAWAPDAAAGVLLIEGYTEEIAQGTHTLTYTTSYADAPYATVDDPVLGLLDSGNTIGY